MKRHLNDLTADSVEAKSCNMSEVDQICGISTKEDVNITDMKIEYIIEELDITFVENKYEDYCSEHLKEEAPYNIKQALPNPILGEVLNPYINSGYSFKH